MKLWIKKYLKYVLIGFAGFMLIGIVGSLFESWEYIPRYTPKSFLMDVKKAEKLNTINHLPVDVHSTDTSYSYTKVRRRRSVRSIFPRPTLCSMGSLYQNNTSRSSIRCNKSFIKHYELANASKQIFDYAIRSIESENWVRQGSDADYKKNLNNLVANGTGTLNFKNERLKLIVTAKNKKECIKDNLNEFFCDGTKTGVAAYVSVTISADYSDF